jgi:hypothetical protein
VDIKSKKDILGHYRKRKRGKALDIGVKMRIFPILTIGSLSCISQNHISKKEGYSEKPESKNECERDDCYG